MTNNGRYCSVSQSLKQSCQEVKAMRAGKMPKTSWDDFIKNQKKAAAKKSGE